MPRKPKPSPVRLVPPTGPWLVLCFEASCGKMWRVEVRERDGKRETRRIEERRL